MNVRKDTSDAIERTIEELKTIANAEDVHTLSQLSLPQIDRVVSQLKNITPEEQGSVIKSILGNLMRVSKRQPSLREDQDGNQKSGISRMKDTLLYGTMYMTPAAVLLFYQQILKGVGIQMEDAFEEGYWQFYVDYALREDTARHANETHGFDTILERHRISLSKVDRIAAWVMAAVYCLHQYDSMLHNEWRERVYLRVMRDVTASRPTDEAAYFRKLYRLWERERPYRRGSDVKPGHTYSQYRRMKFDDYVERALTHLSDAERREWVKRVQAEKRDNLPAYQRQMSILSYLRSGPHGEERTPIELEKANIGLVHKGRYYLLPVCRPNSAEPTDISTVRAQVAKILDAGEIDQGPPPTSLTKWATTHRAHIPYLREKMRLKVLAELDQLRMSPILINADQRPPYLTLSELRQTERGMGTQAMTIFDTAETFVFDQSHIFFDGTWGAAMAEIVTNEAISWGVYLNTLPPIHPPVRDYTVVDVSFDESELTALAQSPKVMHEVSAETEAVNLRNLLSLRRVFKLRNDLIQLTVNDLLVLYRAIHAYTYQPEDYIVNQLAILAQDPDKKDAAVATQQVINTTDASNPAILIPVDASKHAPRDRLHPMNFQVPIHELNLLTLHREVIAALDAYKRAGGDRTAEYKRFDQLQREYLTALAGLGTVFAQAKRVASVGRTYSVDNIKLLAHLPKSLQRLLDKIPNQFEILNDLIKGREVFSNIGSVAPTSSLVRFMSAKDDNENKELAWGVLTDAENVMRITLRDFRKHVRLLDEAGRRDLALRIAEDYLNAYARGLNDFVRDLRRVTMASRETRLASDIGTLDV